MKKLIIVILVLGAIGAIVFMNLKNKKKGTEVETATIELQDVAAMVSCTGKIEARKKVDISANVIGEIVNLSVKEGEEVTAGQFLLQIDKAQLAAQTSGNQAALAALRADAQAARASARQAKLDHDRAKRNYEDEIVPEADLQRAKSALDGARANVTSVEKRIEQAKATLEGSRDSLDKTTIRSPINGTVTSLPVEAGEIAVLGTMNNAGTRLMTISDMSVVEAHMEVDETDIPRVALDQAATISIDAFPNETFEGKVVEIGSSPISNAGSQAVEFEVKIVLLDPPATIRPGFSVSAEIETGHREAVVAIPIQALVVQDMATKVAAGEKKLVDSASEVKKKSGHKPRDIEGVFTIEDGKATFVAVTTGLQGELIIEVTDGIAAGAEVITGPFRVLRRLEEGDEVRIKEEDEDEESAD